MDGNFELSSFRIDILTHPTKRQGLHAKIEKQEIQQYHPECVKEEEILDTYMKQEKL